MKRHLLGIGCGAFLAGLPAVLLSVPDYVWRISCERVMRDGALVLSSDLQWVGSCAARASVFDGTPLKWIVMLVCIGACVVAGALAARLAGSRPVIVAALAPVLAYTLVLRVWTTPLLITSSLLVFVGSLGVLGTVPWLRAVHRIGEA